MHSKIITLLITIFLVGCIESPKGKNLETGVEEKEDGSLNETDSIGYTLDSLLFYNSESELKSKYGKNVVRSTGYYPEGMGEYQNTILFPNSNYEVEFVWLNDSIDFSQLAYLRIGSDSKGWKTRQGISIGTSLKQLEELNKKTFTFYGFEWDYSGMVNWNGGELEEEQIFVTLAYPGDMVEQEHESIIGDHEILSSSDLAQKVNPIVSEIIMKRVMHK